MFPNGRPTDARATDPGALAEYSYLVFDGTTRFLVREQVVTGASVPSANELLAQFCMKCLGRVVADIVMASGPAVGRWALIDTDSSGGHRTAASMYRLVASGQRLYVISAETKNIGQPISPRSGWFLESFALCSARTAPCSSAGGARAPVERPSPFKYPEEWHNLDMPIPNSNPLEELHGRVGASPAQTFFDYQVDESVMVVPGSAAPVYPPLLKERGIEGEVIASFIVDTTGLADVRSLKILKSAHALFADAVKAALPEMRFIPARLRGQKVRQLVMQPFIFKKDP